MRITQGIDEDFSRGAHVAEDQRSLTQLRRRQASIIPDHRKARWPFLRGRQVFRLVHALRMRICTLLAFAARGRLRRPCRRCLRKKTIK